MFPGLDLRYADPAEALKAAGEELDGLDHDRSDVCKGAQVDTLQSYRPIHPLPNPEPCLEKAPPIPLLPIRSDRQNTVLQRHSSLTHSRGFIKAPPV